MYFGNKFVCTKFIKVVFLAFLIKTQLAAALLEYYMCLANRTKLINLKKKQSKQVARIVEKLNKPGSTYFLQNNK